MGVELKLLHGRKRTANDMCVVENKLQPEATQPTPQVQENKLYSAKRIDPYHAWAAPAQSLTSFQMLSCANVRMNANYL